MQASAETSDLKRRSPDWLVAAGWLCLATYWVWVGHRYWMAAAGVLIGVGHVADNVLLQRSDAKWRLYLLRAAATAVLVIAFWSKLGH